MKSSNPLPAVSNLYSTVSQQEVNLISVTIEMTVLLVSNESVFIGISLSSECEFHNERLHRRLIKYIGQFGIGT